MISTLESPHYLSQREDLNRLKEGQLIYGVADDVYLVSDDRFVSEGLINLVRRVDSSKIKQLSVWANDIDLVPITLGSSLKIIRFDERKTTNYHYLSGDAMFEYYNKKLPQEGAA